MKSIICITLKLITCRPRAEPAPAEAWGGDPCPAPQSYHINDGSPPHASAGAGSSRGRQHTSGFTLLEILVALTVFAIIATLTSSVMYNAFNTRAHVSRQADRLSEVQLAMALIRRDTQQIVERPVRGEQMRLLPAFIGRSDYIEFTRSGAVNPDGNMLRSTLIRMALLCRNNQLIRRSWDVPDTPNRNKYQDRVLLNNLDQCKFAYLAQNQQILSEWHENAVTQNQRKETLPKAIQFTFNLTDWGNMSLLFAIPEALYAA